MSCGKIRSRIKESNRLVKETQIIGKAHQSSINHLTEQLSLGNKNSGIGTKPIGHRTSEVSDPDGARVFLEK